MKKDYADRGFRSMNIEEILTALEDLVENSWTLPMSGGRSVVDSAQILEFVKEMRLNIPAEMKKAKLILSERDDIIIKAKNEAQGIIQAAQAQAKQMISKEEVYLQAQTRANEIITTAQSDAKELRKASYEYCDNMLKRSEESLKKSLEDVIKLRKNVRSADK